MVIMRNESIENDTKAILEKVSFFKSSHVSPLQFSDSIPRCYKRNEDIC